MGNTSRIARHAQHWGVGFGMAVIAVAAAAMGAASAHADTIDQLFAQAEDDMTKVANELFGAAGNSSLSAKEVSNLDQLASAVQQQGGLIAQVQSSQDELPAADQANPLLIAADQQLAHASDAFASANNTFVDATQAGDLPVAPGDFTGALAAFDLAGTELFQVLPAEIDAALAPLALGVLPAFDPAEILQP